MIYTSDISLFWLIPWAIISGVLAYYLYSKSEWYSELHFSWKWLLRIARAASIFLIGVLLLGIIFQSFDYKKEKPVFVTLIDNSASMKNYADSNRVLKQITELRKKIKERFGARFELVEMTVGSQVKYNGSVDFKDPNSALEKGFEKIMMDYYNRNLGGVLFVSDGNFNTGSNPLYTSSKLNLTPIFTLGAGDSIPKRDHYIKNISVNEVAFLKNKFPVEVDIDAIKLGKGTYSVTISKGGKTIASKSITYEKGQREFKQVAFELEADQLGFNTYSVTIAKAENEYNYENNTRNFYIEVLDSKSKVIILAGAPHPDIAAIKDVLEENANFEVKSVLAKDWDKDMRNVDMIVWHEPGINADANLIKFVNDQNKPMLYVLGPNTPSNVVNSLNFGLSTPGGNKTDEIQGTVNKGFQPFEISDEMSKAFEYFPPLKSKFGSLSSSNISDILVYQRIGSVVKKDPLVFFLKKGETKIGVIYGEGMWRWKMNEFVRTKDIVGYREFLQKTSSFLTIKQNTSALRITLPNRFTKNEEVIVNASFYNESMAPITTPKIQFTLKDEDKKVSKMEFATYGEGYKLSLGKLKPGKYEWTATTSHAGKTYSKTGAFVVENITLEGLDTYANHNLLIEMSDKSMGKFEKLANYDKLLDAIAKREDISSVSYKETNYLDLIDYKWLFFLLLFFLTLEWFGRRINGIY
jgi:hypothetical protein